MVPLGYWGIPALISLAQTLSSQPTRQRITSGAPRPSEHHPRGLPKKQNKNPWTREIAKGFRDEQNLVLAWSPNPKALPRVIPAQTQEWTLNISRCWPKSKQNKKEKKKDLKYTFSYGGGGGGWRGGLHAVHLFLNLSQYCQMPPKSYSLG